MEDDDAAANNNSKDCSPTTNNDNDNNESSNNSSRSSTPVSSTRMIMRPRFHKRHRSISRTTIPLLGPSDNNKAKKTKRRASTRNNNNKTAADDSITPNSTAEAAAAAAVQYSIRSMTLKDIADVYHLGNAVFTASEFPNMYRTWDDFAVVEALEESPEFCFVVELSLDKNKNNEENNNDDKEAKDDNNKNNKNASSSSSSSPSIIGFLVGNSMEKKKNKAENIRGYIEWVAVVPEYRRQGIASALLAKFQDVAATQHNIRVLLADTPADNFPALNLFATVNLNHKMDHVYLTKQLHKGGSSEHNTTKHHVDPDDGSFDFTYTATRSTDGTKQKIRIRNMKLEDLHPIHEIGERIFTHANLYHFWDESVVLHSYASDPELCITATVEDPDHHNEEIVVGFAFGTTIEKPKSSWRYGYLVWLGCHPDYQGLGLASAIYNTMVELFALEKVRMLMIDTQSNNQAALKFFRKLGFGHDEQHVYLSNAPLDGSIPSSSSSST